MLLNYQIATGTIDATDVSGRTFALLADTPPVMSDGDWRVGLLIDDQATPLQVEKMTEVLRGHRGGVPAGLANLRGEWLGVIQAPATYEEEGDHHRVEWGDLATMEVEDHRKPGMDEPVKIANLLHPSNSTLTAARAATSTVSVFGIKFGEEGTAGHRRLSRGAVTDTLFRLLRSEDAALA